MNVIHIETDQLAAKWLGCYGNPAAHTPNIDKMACNGTMYKNCFANNPVCMPSRASTITGRSSHHHGVFYNGWELGTDMITFPQVLQKHGVQTFGVGKYHLECHARSAYNNVLKYGFDRAKTTEDIRAGDWLDWVKEEHPDCYEQALATAWPTECLKEYGAEKIDLNCKILEARKKYPRKKDHCSDNLSIAYESPVPEKACQTQWITNEAISFIEERDSSKPFFLKVSYVDPHDPYDPPSRFLEMIESEKIPVPLNFKDESVTKIIERFADINFVARMSKNDWMEVRRHYFASLAFVDEQIGRLLDYLKKANLQDDTVIIFSSDHGDMLGDYGLPTKGGWHFDACIRIPMIICGPGLPEGKVVDEIVSNLDIFPTVTGLAGINHDVSVEGRDLLAPAKRSTELHDAFLVETFGSYGDTSFFKRAKTVVTQDYRYTLYGDGTEMLFCVKDDPDESINLSADPALTDRMRKLMLKLLAAQDNPLPSRNKHPSGEH